MLVKNLEKSDSIYMLPKYEAYFSEKLAKRYEPIVYSGGCMSGDPEAVYYRILQNKDRNELCIQYFYYWLEQHCPMSSHRYDYEPIFTYLKSDESNPFLIVNVGLGTPDCHFYKIEVHSRNGKKDNKVQHITANLSPLPLYPFGKDGNVKYDVCVKTYPFDSGEGLQFEEDSNRPLFGIRACSNVFSGARGDLHGHRFNPPLKKLTDKVLIRWYFEHYKAVSDMPFAHDVSDPFTLPYIKFLARPFDGKKNWFEVHLDKMDANQPYLPIKIEDLEYEVMKNERGELELFEMMDKSKLEKMSKRKK